jgi:hypothetical protein
MVVTQSDADAVEAERISTIMRHLEEMNCAAADLNTVQEKRDACLQERQRLVEMWAVGSARLAQAISAQHLAKARPFFLRQRECRILRHKVEAASKAFSVAQEAGVPELELRSLTEKHATTLKQFLACKSDVDKMMSSKKKAALYATVKSYFDAEDEHHAQLQEANKRLELCDNRVDTSKTDYRRALRLLEDLSNETHIQQGTAVPGKASQSKPPASPSETPLSSARSPGLPAISHTSTEPLAYVDAASVVDGIGECCPQFDVEGCDGGVHHVGTFSISADDGCLALDPCDAAEQDFACDRDDLATSGEIVLAPSKAAAEHDTISRRAFLEGASVYIASGSDGRPPDGDCRTNDRPIRTVSQEAAWNAEEAALAAWCVAADDEEVEE